jgi:hypothetical protein
LEYYGRALQQTVGEKNCCWWCWKRTAQDIAICREVRAKSAGEKWQERKDGKKGRERNTGKEGAERNNYADGSAVSTDMVRWVDGQAAR